MTPRGRGRITVTTCFVWTNIDSLAVTEVAALPAVGLSVNSSTSAYLAPDKWTPTVFNAPGLGSSKAANGAAAKLTNAHCLGLGPQTSCSINCTAKSETSLACQEIVHHEVTLGDRVATLASYFTVRFLSFTAIRVVFPLLDAAVLEIAREHGGDFGIQRLFASVGFVVVRVSCNKGKTVYILIEEHTGCQAGRLN